MSADAEVDAHDDWDAASRSGRGIAELGDAHALPAPILGSAIAPTLFGIALPCGLNSTVTATLAGQAVMEGFLDIRLPPWLRRLVTRIIAIVPVCHRAEKGGSGMGLLPPRRCPLFRFFTVAENRERSCAPRKCWDAQQGCR